MVGTNDPKYAKEVHKRVLKRGHLSFTDIVHITKRNSLNISVLRGHRGWEKKCKLSGN